MAIQQPNTRLELTRNNFDISETVTAEATQDKVLGIDFARLFSIKTGNVASGATGGISIPIIGSLLTPKTVQSFALYELLEKNPNYDVVMYPRFSEKSFGFPLLYKHTTVTVTARMGKVK